MASTLRSRLWLSYALLLITALILSALFLVFYLPRSPLAYYQTYQRMTAVQELLLADHPDLTSLPQSELLPILKSADDIYKARVQIYSPDKVLIADSRASKDDPAVIFRRPVVVRTNLLLRDTAGNVWLFHISEQTGGTFLLTGVVRPQFSLKVLLANEILPPFLIAGLASLALSLLAAVGLARWIGNPLESLVAASHRLPEIPASSIPLKGPREIQELTHAYNQMTARMQASQRSQRDFVANVSHELKTPLTSIQGFAQALQDGTADTPEERKRAAGIIQEEAERMNRMVFDLLDLARMDGGTFMLQRGEVDLPALLKNIAERFSPKAAAAGVSIKVEAMCSRSIHGDGDRLSQVFSNLVDNALKFTQSGGSISLLAMNVESPIPGVQIVVSDTGTGIPAEALGHIFERFYQADASRPGGSQHGTGLGLAIAREIITAHRGTISVMSEVGKGSTFTVTLPVDGHPAPAVKSRKKTLT